MADFGKVALSQVNNLSKDIDMKLAEKATKQEVQSVASGSPKGAYATLADLQTAFPTGTTGVYVVTADGKWYYWNGTAWTVGGTYQATGLTKGQVKASDTAFMKLDTTQNMFDGVYQRKYLSGTSGALTLSNQDSRLAMFVLEPNSTYSIAVSPDISSTLKIATATAPVADGGTFNGATNVNAGSKTRLVTVTNDIYLYVSTTAVSPTVEPYLKVVKSNTIVSVSAGETTYPFVPNNVGIYSKGEVDVKLTDVNTKLLSTRKVQVSKSGDSMLIYVPSNRSSRYTAYTFSRDVDASKNLDVWRTMKIEITDQNLTTLYQLDSGYDVDGVVKINGENDYTGGYHGYETMKNMAILLDGKLKNASDSFSMSCETVKIIVQSETYKRSTTNVNFEKYKILEFSKDGVHIYSKYTAKVAMRLDIARLCLLSIEKMSNGVKMLDYYTENVNFLPVAVKPEAESTNGQELIVDNSIKEVELFSEELHVKVWRGESTEINSRGSIVDFLTRIKPYLDPIRDADITIGQVFDCNFYYQINS